MTTVQHNPTNGSTQSQAPQTDYTASPKLSEIEIDEEFNARQGPGAYRNIGELAESIHKMGQLSNIQVIPNKKGAEKPWFAIGGFRRLRAFGVLALRADMPKAEVDGSIDDFWKLFAKAKPKHDPTINVLVKQFEGERFDDRLIEARYANLASDGGTDPLRDYEYAARCHYFHLKLGASAAKIAGFIGKSTPTVYNYLKLFEKLSPEVKQTWSQAPSPDKEIPIGKLLQWTKRTPSEQKVLMDKYVSGDDSPVYEGGTQSEGDKDKPKKRIDQERPKLKEVKAELERIEEKREGLKKGSVDEALLIGASKALRYVLGDISRIF